MSQRRTKMDRSNFFYKLLYERNTLGTMPVSIYNSAKNNRYLLQRLSLERELNVHSGCVNTICWNSTGQYLLSGSDDLHLCITDAFTGELRSKIRTGHVTNIFSAKYLPNTNDSQVISCSGDGVIIYTDLNRPESSHKNIFDCQEESVYDIATVPNDSHTFLTCSHDRTVRWYDLRVKTSCLKHPSYSRFARRSLQHKCNDDVLIRCDYPVTAIAVNSLMPWQLSIGCSDSIIRIYDRRMLTTTSLGGYLGDQDQSVLAKFTYNGLKNPNRITSLAYSRNCQQILASYSNDHLYLFDINDVKKTIEFGLERDIIPDKSQKQSCSFKRFRLRGDWSDTGPNAMTTNELRSTVSASVAAATAAAAAAAAIADTPLATTTNNTSTTGTSVPASSSSPVASFSASVANNSSSSSSFYAAQPQSSQITTTAAQSSSDLTESAAAQRAITTTTTNTTTTTTDSAEPNNRSSAARLRNLNTILSLILRSSFSRRSGGEEGAAADASSSTDAAPSSDEQEQPNDVVPMLLDDLEPSTVSEHLTNNDSVSLPSIASMSGADSDYSRPYPHHHHHHHHHQHSHLNATSSQPASPSPLPLTSPLANASTTSAATFRTNPFSSLPQPQPPSLSTLAQRYQLDDFLLDSARALRTTSTTAPATTPSATSPLATTASPTPVSTNSRSSSSPPDTVTTPSNNASRYFLQFFDPAPFPNFLNRFDDEEDDDDEEGVPELGARWPPAESSVTSNRTNDGSSSNNNNNNDSTMATNASTPNTTTTTTTTSNNLEDNQSYNNIRHSHYIADLGDDIDSDTTNDSVFNHAGSDSLQAPVPIVRNLVTGRQRSRSSSSNDSPRNFLYHHQLPSSIPNSASSLASGLYPSSTNNNNNDSSSSNPTLNRASERRNLRNINRTRLRNPTTAQATQQRLNRLRDSLGGGGGARNFDELSFMDDEDEDQESDIMHNSYYHSPYLHHPDSYHHFINQSYQPPTSTNSSSTNHLNNRGTSQTPPSSSSSQAKRLKTYKIRDYKTFVGHRNSRTVIKEATFWGDDYIVSGSDCGHIFFWSIKTCELVMIMEGDLHVVNCLQPHPTDPILASSGIDYNIKLWSPMSEENQFDENRAKTIISRNERMLEENRDTVTVPARFVLSLFSSIRNRQHPVRSQPFSVPQSGVNNNNNNNNHHHHHDSGSSVAASPNLVDSFSPWMRESNAVPSTGSGMQPDVTPDGTSVGPRNVEVEDDEEEEEEEAWLPTSGDILVAVEDELDDEFEEDELMPANDDHDDDDEDDADIERIPL